MSAIWIGIGLIVAGAQVQHGLLGVGKIVAAAAEHIAEAIERHSLSR